jgi:uncharacterized membrane protein (Fun14 family)
MDQATSQLIATFATQVGVGGASGFLVGYGIRKIAGITLKVGAVALTLFTIPLIGLEALGVMKVDYEALAALFENSLTRVAEFAASVTPSLLRMFPVTGSFGLGIVAGAMRK